MVISQLDTIVALTSQILKHTYIDHIELGCISLVSMTNKTIELDLKIK